METQPIGPYAWNVIRLGFQSDANTTFVSINCLFDTPFILAQTSGSLCLSLYFSSSFYFGFSTQICVVVVVVVLRSYDEELSVYQRRSLRSSVFDGKHNPLRSSELSFPLFLFLLSMFLHIIIIICYIRYGRVERRGDDRNSCLSIH